ncbi:MAG: methylmalonyl Co-A mutase-associated GTPase MeaB [Hyphomicrobiaceae bacterium]
MSDLMATRNSRPDFDLDDLVAGVISGDRTTLARAITLVESTKPGHQEQSQELLQALLQRSVTAAHRIGITGVPGVGKSTVIDQLGTNLTASGHKVAVLAVDPTSSRSGGSILGDKTRMARLATDPNAYIRPSPTAGTLGGVTKKTRETMALCEAAGFDIVIVETVGVGQSEIAVSEMVDVFLFLALPGAGDELQGIKKGILEIADIIAVNKADGDNIKRATQAAAEYRSALRILTPTNAEWPPTVHAVSGLANTGLDELWSDIQRHRDVLKRSGAFDERRKAQDVRWMHDLIADKLHSHVLEHGEVAAQLPRLENAVRNGERTPSMAAADILKIILQND